jgi:dTDP-4-dehydrorhamnose reductase
MEGGRLLVVRGQSLYGAAKKSFPDAILRAAGEKGEIPVVVDQIVSPTWARDFAEGLVLLLERGATGLFHLSASGRCTWNEFARAVLEEAGVRGVRITATTASDLGRPAPRPARSDFDLSKFTRVSGAPPRSWRDQLRGYLRSTGRAA